MILDEYVKIKINNQNKKRLMKLLDENINVGDVVNLPIEKLSKSSHYKIKVKCDVCGNEKYLSYQKYNSNINKHNIYTCNNSCAQIKNRKTSLENFGVDHHSKTEDFKQKLIKYNSERINYTLIEKIKMNIEKEKENVERLKRKKKEEKEKIKKENYKNMVKKVEKTKLEKYGNKHYNNREKMKETCFEKYGVENTSKIKEIQDKWKQTNLERYGVENVFQSEEIKEKIKNTNLEKYGVEYPSQSETIMEKILISSNRERLYDIKSYEIYKYNVYNKTNIIKKEMFDNWDGFDYYDGEYIKENINLKYYDKNYPTIDHKKSILYCFLNDISIEDCANINNLCITTRSNNSKKNRKIETEYINNSL